MIPRLDEATSFAIQSSSNINYIQMRELHRNLKVALGDLIFAPEYRIKQMFLIHIRRTLFANKYNVLNLGGQ